MDQVKMVMGHLAAHRFWYVLGLAALFTTLISGGTTALDEKAKAKSTLLDGALKNVEAIRGGAELPNSKWSQQLAERTAKVSEKVGGALGDRYQPQEKLFTWPPNLAEVAKGLPFGFNIEGKFNKNLEAFQAYCEEPEGGAEALSAFYELKALSVTPKGTPFGVVQAPGFKTLFAMHKWTSVPSSLDAWLYQEELWLKRAAVRAIARCNEKAERDHPNDAIEAWKAARIKRVDAINLGTAALDPAALIGGVVAAPYVPLDPANPQTKSQLASSARYSEKTAEFRTVPLSLNVVVDQHQITPILREFANIEFNFEIRNVRISPLPGDGKLDKPAAFGDQEILISGRRADNPLYNCVILDVYGACRIFEMPPTLRTEREAAAKAKADAEAKAEADAKIKAAGDPPAPEAKK